MDWLSGLLFLLFGYYPGAAWGDLVRGFGLIAVVVGMIFLVYRWMSRDLQRKQK